MSEDQQQPPGFGGDASARPAPAGSPQGLDYRPPVAEPKSQWWTDDQKGSPWVVGCLLVLTAVGAVAATVWGAVSFLAGC